VSKSKKKKKKVDKVSVRKQIRKEYEVKKREESYHPYTLQQILKLLPDVGDRLMKAPTEVTSVRKPCTVVEVNPIGRWYRVRFDTGYCQCYKIP
jgi:hypothetical protein